MGFLSSIKKLLFASESVAKSKANEAADFAVDKLDDVADAGKDALKSVSNNVSNKTTGLRDALSDQADNVVDRLKDVTEDIKDHTGNILDDVSENPTVKKIQDKIIDTYENIADSEPMKKAAEISEKVGDKVLDTGEDFMEKATETSDKIWEKTSDIGEKLSDKGKEFADQVNEKIDNTVAKARAEEAEEALNPKGKFAEEDLTTGGSLLDGTDDFFSKADRYAKGDYDAFSEGKIEIVDDAEITPTLREPAKAAGFTDLDGDGNEIIDDAIISEEE